MVMCMDFTARPGRRERQLGGDRAVIFVYVTQGLENMAFVANAISLVTYFYGYMNFSLTKSATTLTNFVGTTLILTLVGGYISETYLSRFKTCVLSLCIEILGYGLLTIQAHFKQLRPLPCIGMSRSETDQCEVADKRQVALLFTGLYLVAIGASGVKANLPALGADQFDDTDPKEAAKQSSYFNWFIFSFIIGSLVGVTFIVWLNTNLGWDWAFGVCSIALFLGAASLCFGKSLYRNNVPNGSPLLRIAQVFVAAIRNRKLQIPKNAEELNETGEPDHEILQSTNQFRFLDRAAVKRNTATISTKGSWTLCTVTQVEETKILIRMLPIIVSTIFMHTCLAQLQTFSIQQSLTMDSHVLGIKIPGPSIPAIPMLFTFFVLPLYDRVFIPLARNITGIPTGIRPLQRTGIGLILSAISMAIAGFIEARRKHVAVSHNMVDSIDPLPISLLWLSFQYALSGTADMFTLAGLLEFFYGESSIGMKSLGTAISWCSVSLGSYTSTVVVVIVNKVSGGWLASNNLNRDRLDYFYWLLSVLSLVNFGFYLICSCWYKYKNVKRNQGQGECETVTM